MIGCVITTFNSESYYKALYDTIPFDKIDRLVTVNGGEPYTGDYNKNTKWIQHDVVKYASVARNDGLKYLYNEGCEHMFVIEDDMLIKSPDIFDHYINASKQSGIQYFGFASNAWDAGPIGGRTPRISFQYVEGGYQIELYKNTCNESTYRSRKCLEKVGYYDENFQYTFDIDWLYRASLTDMVPPFWYFPDISLNDSLICNNPDAISRMNPNGERNLKLGPNYKLFHDKHGIMVNKIPSFSYDELRDRIDIIRIRYAK